MSALRKNAAVAALAVCVVGGSEGLRTVAYRDSIGVPTVCWGETKGVHMGDHHTKAECDAKFIVRLDEFGDAVEHCTNGPLPAKTFVAFVSLGYNIGTGGFCKSSVVRRWNAGDRRGACDAMLAFNRAGGRVLAGLTTRRQKERKLCLEGLAT